MKKEYIGAYTIFIIGSFFKHFYLNCNLTFKCFRLREISEEASIPPSQPRKRSNSLPIPQIEISLYQGPSSNSRDSPSGSSTTKDYIELPEAPIVCLTPESPSNGSKTDDGNNHKKRKMKMTDFRAFVETKMFSKSERALEKVGIDVHSDKDLAHAVSI